MTAALSVLTYLHLTRMLHTNVFLQINPINITFKRHLEEDNLGDTNSSEASFKQFLPAWVQAQSLTVKSFHHFWKREKKDIALQSYSRRQTSS